MRHSKASDPFQPLCVFDTRGHEDRFHGPTIIPAVWLISNQQSRSSNKDARMDGRKTAIPAYKPRASSRAFSLASLRDAWSCSGPANVFSTLITRTSVIPTIRDHMVR